MTKRVLILSVIAMLALGVFALATTNGALYGEKVISTNAFSYVNEAQQGPTCSASKLVVYSEIGVEQGYVATATSFDASFCGAPCPCNCADGTSVIYRALSGHYITVQGNPDSILISQLSVESNMQPISVSVTVNGPTSSSGSIWPATYYLVYNLDSTDPIASDFWGTPASASVSMNLSNSSGSGPYTGTIDVGIDGFTTAWGKVVPAGDYVITTTFTISPQNTF